MVLMFINSVEFFIAAFVVAMVSVGVLMKPSEKGEARTYFSRGEMRPSSSDETVVEVTVDERGHLTVVRRGVYLDTSDCELNYAILVIGKDVKITERRADKSITEVCGTTVDVEFRVDCLLRARYHLFIESPWSGQWAAGNVRIGSPMAKRLEVHQ